MAVIAGYNGSVTFATGYTTKLDQWSISFAAEQLDITGFEDSGWQTNIGGLRSWSGSFSGKYDHTASPLGDTTTFAGLGGAAASATFTSSGDADITGSIVITGVDVTVPVSGGPPTISCTFVGSGAPVIDTTS